MLLQVKYTDHVIIGVSNEQGLPLRIYAQSTRLRQLSCLKGSIGVSWFTSPSQGRARPRLRIDHLHLHCRGGGGGRQTMTKGAIHPVTGVAVNVNTDYFFILVKTARHRCTFDSPHPT